MANPPGVYFDGDYSEPVPIGPLLSWQDPDTRSKLYRQKYHQTASSYVPAVIGSAGPDGTGSKLVEETPPTDTGVGGVVEFERVWAVKPATRVRREKYVHAYQAIVESDLIEVPLTVSATVTYEYFETADGSGVPVIKAKRWVSSGQFLFYVGGGVPESDGSGVAEDSEINLWKGNFWERITRRVPAVTVALSE